MRPFLHHCIGCGSHRGLTGPLCSPCASEFRELGQPRLLTLGGRWCWALSEYSGFFRRLILRAKVKGDHAAVAWLESWASAALAQTLLLRSAEAVMPCPSSLWGRLRGRLDLAGNAACLYAQQQNLVLASAPHHLFWRGSKRALAADPTERDTIASALPQALQTRLARRWNRTWGQRLGNHSVVILDDVVTTGRTMLETADAVATLAPDTRLILVALAAAPRLS